MSSETLNAIYSELYMDLKFFLVGGLLGILYFTIYYLNHKKKEKSKKS